MTRSVRELQDDRLRQMSPGEKLRISQQLRETAWAMKAAWLRSVHPAWTEAEVQEAVRAVFRDARG